MGLEVVELVMELEEEFGIKIDDREAETLTTVGMLYDYVLRQLGRVRSSPCLSAAMFYRLRRGIMEIGGCERGRIRPSTPLEEFSSPKNRRAWWSQLSDNLGIRLPSLLRPLPPDWHANALIGVAVAASVTFFFMVKLVVPNNWLAEVVGVIAFVPLAMLAHRLYDMLPAPPENCFAGGASTVGSLAKTLMWQEFDTLAMSPDLEQQASGDFEVWQRLQKVICDSIGASPDQVHWDSQFVRDLGCG